MKGTRHSEEQIIAILKQGEAGLTTAELLLRVKRVPQQVFFFIDPSVVTDECIELKRAVSPAFRPGSLEEFAEVNDRGHKESR